MRIKWNTSIECGAAGRMNSRIDCTEARLLSNGYLAVLFQHYRRAHWRIGRTPQTSGELNGGEGQ